MPEHLYKLIHRQNLTIRLHSKQINTFSLHYSVTDSSFWVSSRVTLIARDNYRFRDSLKIVLTTNCLAIIDSL